MPLLAYARLFLWKRNADKDEAVGVKLWVFLPCSRLFCQMRSPNKDMYINDGAARDFLDTPSLETAWLAAEEDFIVIKEGDDTLPPRNHQQPDSWVVLFVNTKEQFLGSLPELMCSFLSSL